MFHSVVELKLIFIAFYCSQYQLQDILHFYYCKQHFKSPFAVSHDLVQKSTMFHFFAIISVHVK